MFVRGGKFFGQEGRLTHDYQALPKTISHGLVPVLSIGRVDRVVMDSKVNFVRLVLSFLIFPPES